MTVKAKMGRPSKLTPEMQKTICAMIRMGTAVTVACRAVGISRRVFMLWKSKGRTTKIRKYREFARSVDQATAECEVRLIQKVQNAAGETRNWPAATWILERRFKKRWSKQQEQAARAEKDSEQNEAKSAITIYMPAQLDDG